LSSLRKFTGSFVDEVATLHSYLWNEERWRITATVLSS